MIDDLAYGQGGLMEDKVYSLGNSRMYALKTLYAISDIVAGRTGQREMLYEILDVIERDLDLNHGAVMLLSSSGDELFVEALGRYKTSGREYAARYGRGEGVTGRVLQTGKCAVIPRISQEPAFCGRIYRQEYSLNEETSFVCVPIKLENEVIGTLSIDLKYDPELTLEKEKCFLSIVGSLIANDVRNRRRSKMQRQILERENQRLRDALEKRFRPDNIIGNSTCMRKVFGRMHTVAAADTPVLIWGPSGTGKELVASAIHIASPRAKAPFIQVNCSVLSESLFERELFGHEPDSSAGASSLGVGHIERAAGGTLFFDEIGELAPALQVKLLRVLQEGQFERVGGSKTYQADVRVIVATNRNLEEAVAAGSFRSDLYYRINVFPIKLPPLKDRKDDILPLVNHFASIYARGMGKTIRRITTCAIDMMMAYHWPGNVRELENCIEHVVLLSSDGVIHGHHLPPTLQTPVPGNKPLGSLKAHVSALERDMIIDALKRNNGKVNQAAKDLGVTARVIRYKMKNLRIDFSGMNK